MLSPHPSLHHSQALEGLSQACLPSYPCDSSPPGSPAPQKEHERRDPASAILPL